MSQMLMACTDNRCFFRGITRMVSDQTSEDQQIKQGNCPACNQYSMAEIPVRDIITDVH